MSVIDSLWLLISFATILATLFSALPARAWWVRICDFPRAQVLFVGLCMLVFGCIRLSAWWGTPWAITLGVIVSLFLLAAMTLQAWWFVRLTPLASKEVPDAFVHAPSDDAEDDRAAVSVRIMTANVDFTNEDRAAAIESLVAHDPDVLALVEPDESWSNAIEQHAGCYKHQVHELRAKGRGVSLLSRFPIIRSEIRCLVSDDRPSIWAELQLSEDITVGVCVLHPPPPGLPKRSDSGRVSSKPRDLELDLAAKIVASSPMVRWIVAGDFNDVGWSATTMRAKRLGSLLDPRIGRGMFSTFPSHAPLLRYPIDHVLLSEGIQIRELRRLPSIGSDHLPLLADLVLSQQTAE
jgi:endonuclease/exonuclease/phosphatase (EEP) superfamily protein YafD